MSSVLSIAAFYSSLHDYASVKSYLDEFLSILSSSGLSKYYKGAFASKQEPASSSNVVIYAITGGTSSMIYRYAESARRAYVVYHEEHNSLASASNAVAMLRHRGVSAELISIRDFADEAPSLYRAAKALESLQGSSILVVGSLSQWVVDSGIVSALESQLKVKVEVVGFQDLEKHVVQDSSIHQYVAGILQGSSKVAVEHTYVEKAVQALYALKSIARERGTSNLAVKCFDMLKLYGYTGCIALAELLREGYVAACEADVQAAVVMRILREVSKSDPWMGNVSHVSSGYLELSHCTISRSLVKSYNLVTHFESGLPVSIEGVVEEGVAATIVGYDALRKLWRVIEGVVARGRPQSSKKCRTQVLFAVSPEASRAILEDPIEGHYVVVFKNVFRDAVLAGELAGMTVEAYPLKA